MTTEKSTDRRASGAVVADDPVGARERILAAATRFFQRYGYEGTSIARIAAAAEMTPANIYWHFPSKIDLLADALRGLYNTSYEVLAAAAGSGAAEERLANYTRAYIRMQLTELDDDCNFGYASLASSLSSEKRHELLLAGRPYLDLLRDILEQGREEGVFTIQEPTVISFAIATMCEYVFTWYRAGGRLTIDEVGDRYAEFVLRMVRA